MTLKSRAACWCGVLLGAAVARAEVFELYSGGLVEGRLLNPSEEPRESYRVETELGNVVLLPAQVRRMRVVTEAEQRYAEFLAKMPPTLDGNWRMAEWCHASRLERQRAKHLEAVLDLDPNHEGARRGLGYSQNKEGEWHLPEVTIRESGYVSVGGRVVTPEEALLAQSRESEDLEVKAWRPKVTMWRTWILKGRGKEEEGRQALLTIRHPSAALALSEQLKEKDEPPALKLLYIEVLGALRSGVGVAAFIDLALHDPDAKVRSACLSQLADFGRLAAQDAFIAALGDKNNDIVNRAGAGLARVGEQEAVLPLIDALTTKHRFQVSGGGGINPTFSNDGGGGGLGVGGRPKIIEQEFQNASVRDALAALLKVNYGFDKERWRDWYVRQHAPPEGSLRRAP